VAGWKTHRATAKLSDSDEDCNRLLIDV